LSPYTSESRTAPLGLRQKSLCELRTLRSGRVNANSAIRLGGDRTVERGARSWGAYRAIVARSIRCTRLGTKPSGVLLLLSNAKKQKPAAGVGFLLVRDVLGAVAVGSSVTYSSFNGFRVEERHQLARVLDALDAAVELGSLGDRKLLMHDVAANFGRVM
jgi:hypothetical protein